MGKKEATTKPYGLLILSVGGLAAALQDVAEHALGSLDDVAVFSVSEQHDLEKQKADLQTLLVELDGGGGVLMLVDMFGSAAANLAMDVSKRDNVEMIAGANLPMLLKSIDLRGKASLREVTERVIGTGRTSIEDAREFLKDG